MHHLLSRPLFVKLAKPSRRRAKAERIAVLARTDWQNKDIPSSAPRGEGDDIWNQRELGAVVRDERIIKLAPQSAFARPAT